MKTEDLKFLSNVFENKSGSELEEYFGDLFGSVLFKDDQKHKEREEERAKVKEAIDELTRKHASRCDDDQDMDLGFIVRKICKDISEGAKQHAELEHAADEIERVISLLKEYIKMSDIWWKHNPRIGGRDEHAYNLAEAVAYIFKEMVEPVKAGTYKNAYGEILPSTKFGKVVRRAFEHHSISSSWISPHRSVANKYKK